ncbi:MAG TPA: hypothetical protein VF756_14535 [Thermoanaerobaculia bacterium]
MKLSQYRSFARAAAVATVSLITSLALPSPVRSAEPRWQPLGLYGGTVNAVAVAPSARRVLYAFTPTGLFFKSVDAGAHWRPVGSGIPGGSIPGGSGQVLVVDPRDPDVVYVGFQAVEAGRSRFYKTTDGGETWSWAGQGLGENSILALAIDPRDSSILFAATGLGLFQSDDAGATWRLNPAFPSHPEGNALEDVVFDPFSPGVLYVAAGERGLFKSEDGGATWQLVWQGEPWQEREVLRIALDPASPGTLYLGLFRGQVLTTTDGGATWTRSVASPDFYLTDLAVSPDGATVYEASSGGVFRSGDGGQTWERSLSFGYTLVTDLAVPLSPPGVVYAAMDLLGVFKSSNRGETWREVSQGILGSYPIHLAIAPSNPSYLYASVVGRGVLRSSDGGASWRPASGGMGDQILKLAVDPRDFRVVHAAADFGRMWKTTNAGRTWTLTSIEDGGCVFPRSLFVHPRRPQNVFVSGVTTTGCDRQHEESCLVFQSPDGGASWSCLKGIGEELFSFVSDPVRLSSLYGVDFQDVLRSTDAGGHWAPAGTGLPPNGFKALAASPSQSGVLYAATSQGVFKSIDGARTWRPARRGLAANARVVQVEVAPSAASVLYAVVARFNRETRTDVYALYRSADAARHWKPVTLEGLPGTQWSVVVDPRRPNRLYATTELGIYRIDLR